MIPTILFIDLDGTILVNPFLTAVFPHLARHLTPAIGLSEEELLAEALAEHAERLRQPERDPRWIMDWDDIVETVVRRHGAALPAKVNNLVVEYARPPYISILNQADDVLRRLKAPHRKLVVASAGLSRYQMPVLKALGMALLFDDYLMPDLTGCLKTDPGFYARYSERTPRPRLISVGDSYRDDVIYPKRFGFHAVLKAPALPETLEVAPDAVITSFAELPAVIDKIEAITP